MSAQCVNHQCAVRATISPDNMVSRLPVLQEGFVEVGERREDGLETIFEVAAGPTHRRTGAAGLSSEADGPALKTRWAGGRQAGIRIGSLS
ncbi:UNVERIFIED_ORG: hypothetical protein ABIB52_000684 [Arthrobacter sp. UYCu721]